MSFRPSNEGDHPPIRLADAPPPHESSQEPASSDTDAPTGSDPLKTLQLQPLIVEALSKVYDPEIPVNIYELGLVYDIEVDREASVTIRMTLTAPACPAAQTIPAEVERRIREIPGVRDVRVDIVWDPPWSRERMSEAAKLTLGLF
jgi:FeS assembly SUF system protein